LGTKPQSPHAGELTVLDYPEVDFNQPQTLPEIVRAATPDVIINAVAYTNVDKAESEPDIARRINADAVGEIAHEAKKLSALLIHYSTDYVFDGTKGSPYVETDTPNPLNVYGKTKLDGKKPQRWRQLLTFRTSWVYSNRTGGFVNKFWSGLKPNPSCGSWTTRSAAPPGRACWLKQPRIFCHGTASTGTGCSTGRGFTTWPAPARSAATSGSRKSCGSPGGRMLSFTRPRPSNSPPQL